MLLANDGAEIICNESGDIPIRMSRMEHTNKIRGALKYAEPMAGHTSWRTGGIADEYFEPADLQDLCLYLATCANDKELLWLGLGSNLLVRDGGFRGTVIAYSKALNEIEIQPDGYINVEAGVPCAKVARASAKAGYTGAEFLAGIPGTIGGALAMNAGAFGGETWNVVNRVKTINRAGNIKDRMRSEFNIAYRSVHLPDEEWFVSAEIELRTGRKEESEKRIKEFLDKRSESQPMGLPSCGSVFRNPPGDHAARLIEQCGLKGKKIGKACVSEKHANFIINMGSATSEDIENLILLARETVYETHGIKLEPEVKIVGEKK